MLKEKIKRYILLFFLPILRRQNKKQIEKYNINVLDTITSLNLLRESNLSISRFGDGEFDLINGKNLQFQSYTPEIGNRLKEILEIKSDIKDLKVAIPCVYKHLEEFNNNSQLFWISYYKQNRKQLYQIFNKQYEYFDSQITRIYINRRSIKLSMQYFQTWKDIWKDKEVLLIEGENSRFGVGNDLFDNTKSIKRILCPAENAYNKYDEIMKIVLENAENKLILLVLGPTATIMAYDLAKLGIRALDIGNMDMEYEWYKRKTKNKIKIEGKYSLEVSGGTTVSENIDTNYINQIICKII